MSAEEDVQLKDFGNIFQLHGKVAVVTGGSRGLGLHAASGLLQAGCSRVFIISRKSAACSAACSALNALPLSQRPGKGTATPLPADLSKPAEIQRVATVLSQETPHIDILLANAGATWGAPLTRHPPDSFSKVMDLNVKSVFYIVTTLLPLLTARATPTDPARVIITGSIAGIGLGHLGEHATFSYSASKAAAIHLAKNLAVELGPRHVRVNSVAPGFFPSKMADGLMELEGGVQRLGELTPTGRVGRKEDFAAAVVYLAGRGGEHVNGAVLVLDGGAVLARGRL